MAEKICDLGVATLHLTLVQQIINFNIKNRIKGHVFPTPVPFRFGRDVGASSIPLEIMKKRGILGEETELVEIPPCTLLKLEKMMESDHFMGLLRLGWNWTEDVREKIVDRCKDLPDALRRELTFVGVRSIVPGGCLW